MIDFQAASVSDLVVTIKNLLEEEFQEVFVQGEVTNLSTSASGHWYFNLSDENSSISCALFRMDALRNNLIKTLKDGDKITVLGPISVYQKRGTFQLLAKRILPAGAGQLKLQFERLKARLAQEGLFDLERKKIIPKYPKRIAVITAEHGAALQDFLNVYKRRSLWCDIVIIPSLVQGEAAAKNLISCIKKAEQLSNIDTIVLTRGGGSLEDLWPFNDEDLVRTIDQCQIPIISAIGHEVDFTLCDYASDLRCETPTAAAETLTQPQTELINKLNFCHSHLRTGLSKISQRVELLNHKFHPREMIHLVEQKIKKLENQLAQFRFSERATDLIGINQMNQLVDELHLRLLHSTSIRMTTLTEKMKRYEQVLGALNPKLVLKRGYTYVALEDKHVVSSLELFNKLPKESKINLHFHDGSAFVKKDL